ncbi:MAG: vitamin K epoxide reductase family protein [Armatimonadetes bacterium]|nr:vitamin K epoxide reductase family protein [Armatimonadota bacterium]
MSATAETMPTDVSEPARKVNLLTGILGIVGIFIAGVLSIAELFSKEVPCGGTRGCADVAQSAQSHWGPVPVAFIGLGGYLVLTLLSVGRAATGGKTWRSLTKLSLAGTGIGFLVSCYFMYASFVEVEATCVWCVASAVTMTVSLIVTYWLHTLPDAKPRWGTLESMLYGAGLVAAIGGVWGVNSSMSAAGVRDLDSSVGLTQMLPVPAKVKGNEAAPVTIIEFADFNCAACRQQYKLVAGVLKESGDNLRFAYRNLPLVDLKGHATSMHIATLSELAAEKDKFWEFYEYVFRVENEERIKTVEGVKQVAEEVGLTTADIENALKEGSPEAQRVVEDFNLALSYNIRETPTFAVFAKGVPAKVVPGSKLEALLGAEPYNSLLLGR